MTEERFVKEIAKEIKRIEAERKLVEIEYSNYIKELQHMHNIAKAFSCIEKPRKPYPYDMEELKEKHKDKFAKGTGARF